MSINWQNLYAGRKKITERFGDIWDLPVASRYHRVVQGEGGPGTRVLEIGAGDRSFQEKLKGYWGQVDYQSCDIDQTFSHDFNDIDQVRGVYDLVCAFELIEHLSLEEALHMVTRIHDLLVPGGRVAMTTPNTYYPPAFLRDSTHVTPFCYDELGGLFTMAGLRVTSIHRLYHDAVFKKLVRRYLCYPLFRILGIDFAKQVIVIAEKPASGTQ